MLSVVTSVVFGLLLVPGFYAAYFSIGLIFSTADHGGYAAFTAFGVALISYPVIASFSIIASWVFYHRQRG